MMVVERATNKILGFLSRLEEIEDIGKRFMLEPFVHKHNFIVYRDANGNFGVASPKTCVLREVIEK